MAVKITKTKIVLSLAGLALVGWIAFHPHRQAEVTELAPAVQAWVAQKPFGASFQSSVRHVKLRSKLGFDGNEGAAILEQRADLPVAGLVRKTTHRFAEGNSVAVQEENTRLIAGPLTLLHHFRDPLPIVGDLLPYSFWATRRLRDLAVQQNSGFPLQPDGRFSATYVIDEMHTDGSIKTSVKEDMQCSVTGRRSATQYLASLKGEAILFRCAIKSIKTDNYVEDVVQENVYFPALGWAYSARHSAKNNVVTSEMVTENTLLSVE